MAALTLSACHKSSNKAVISEVKGLKTKARAQQCGALRSAELHVDSDKATVRGWKAPGISLCLQPGLLTDYSVYTSENPTHEPPEKYRISKPIRRSYHLSRSEKTLQVKLSLGVDFVLDPAERGEPVSNDKNELASEPADVVAANRSEAMRALKLCAKMLKRTWQASLPRTELVIEIFPGDQSESFDQKILLAGSVASREKKAPARFVFAYLPTYGQLHINAKGADCPTASCVDERLEKANRPFCAQFAHLIGQYLGLQSPKVASEAACSGGVNAVPEGFAADAKPVALQSFMLYAPQTKDFWEKARFSADDLKQILGPDCSAGDDSKKTKVNFDEPTDV